MLLFVCHMSLTLTAVTLPAFLDLDHLNLPLMRKAGRSIYGQFGQSVPQRSLVMPVPLLFSWHCCTAVCLTRFFFVHRIPEVSCWVSMPRSTWWHFFFLQVVGERHLERHKPRWSSRAGCGSHARAWFSGSITTRSAGDTRWRSNCIKIWSLSMPCPWCFSETFYTFLHID